MQLQGVVTIKNLWMRATFGSASANKHQEAALKVIVVEDEFIVRLDVCLQLEDEGFDVIAAGTADEALALFPQELPVDVVFTDVNTPGQIDGLKLAQSIHERWPEVNVIVTSGRRIDPKDVPDSFPFIEKPYNVGHIVEVMHEIVSH